MRARLAAPSHFISASPEDVSAAALSIDDVDGFVSAQELNHEKTAP
jgi:hypothetical protein